MDGPDPPLAPNTSASRPSKQRPYSFPTSAAIAGEWEKTVRVGEQQVRDTTRWLGIWLDAALTLREHRRRCLSLASMLRLGLGE